MGEQKYKIIGHHNRPYADSLKVCAALRRENGSSTKFEQRTQHLLTYIWFFVYEFLRRKLGKQQAV